MLAPRSVQQSGGIAGQDHVPFPVGQARMRSDEVDGVRFAHVGRIVAAEDDLVDPGQIDELVERSVPVHERVEEDAFEVVGRQAGHALGLRPNPVTVVHAGDA